MTSSVALFVAMDRSIRSQSHDLKPLAEFSERFVADLVLTAGTVREAMNTIGVGSIESLIHALAERSARSGVPASAEHTDAIRVQWRSFWLRFSNWFVSEPGRFSSA